jgi:hypothetical protein
MGKAGTAICHSGRGPGGVNAIYHYPDLAAPITVATFANEKDEGAAEVEAMCIALRRGQ